MGVLGRTADAAVPILVQNRRVSQVSALLIPHSHLLNIWARRMELKVPVADTPWKQKFTKVVFRGSGSHGRPHFVKQSLHLVDPELLDLKLTGPPVSPVMPEELHFGDLP